MKHKALATLALVMMTTATTFATGTFSVPHQFHSGDPAVAAEVNENFKALSDAIETIDQRTTKPFAAADDFTVNTVSGLVAGTQVVIDGFTYNMQSVTSLSFAENNNTQYTVIYPKEIGSGSSFVASAGSDFIGSRGVKKTTINGYPVLARTTFVDDNGQCQVVIQLDEDTHTTIYATYLGIGSMATVKADQTKARAHCMTVLNHISITAS